MYKFRYLINVIILQQLNKIYKRILIPDIQNSVKGCTDIFDDFSITATHQDLIHNDSTDEYDLNIEVEFNLESSNIPDNYQFPFRLFEGIYDMILTTTEYVVFGETFCVTIYLQVRGKDYNHIFWWSDGERDTYASSKKYFVEGFCGKKFQD